MTRHGKGTTNPTPGPSATTRDTGLGLISGGSGPTEASDQTATESGFVEITSPNATGTSQHTETEQSEPSTFAGETVRQIEGIIDSFRTGKIKKSQAIFQIGQILASEPTGNEELKAESLDRYVTTLDGIEALAAQSVKHGLQVTDPLLGKRKEQPDSGDRRHAEPEGNLASNARTNEVDNFLASISRENEQEENMLGGGHEDDSDQESEAGADDRGRSNKKQHIYESQMPWFNVEQQF
jgi:hypothetical protein